MIEERFSVRLRSECDGVVYSFFDGDKPLDMDMIVVLLNDQQATISALKEENEQLQQKLKDIYSFKGSNCRCVQQDKIQDLEEKINKLPPKIRELWME